MTRIDLRCWIKAAFDRLKSTSEFPSIEIHAIAAAVLNHSKEWIVAHPETVLEMEQINDLDKAISRLTAGEPLAYITNTLSFYGLDFFVNNHVLIPRPETELLVEHALDWLSKNPDRRHVADIGTGSGAIAVSLAHHCSDIAITATDVSAPALEVARKNAFTHQVDKRITFLCCNLLEDIAGDFDLILANLPYIPSKDIAQIPVSRFEPLQALDGGIDGMVYINALIGSSRSYLKPGGCIMLEIQFDQSRSCQAIARKFFPNAEIFTQRDLNNLHRLVIIQR